MKRALLCLAFTAALLSAAQQDFGPPVTCCASTLAAPVTQPPSFWDVIWFNITSWIW